MQGLEAIQVGMWNIILINICICIPGTQMTSIFKGQPPKTRPKLQSKQGSFGFQVYILILYLNILIFLIKESLDCPMIQGKNCYTFFGDFETFPEKRVGPGGGGVCGPSMSSVVPTQKGLRLQNVDRKLLDIWRATNGVGNPYNGYINPYYWVEFPIPYYMEMSWELIDPIAHIAGTRDPKTNSI